MAATTGTPLYPGSATFPGSTTYPGGGDLPQLEVLYTTDDANDPTPSWSYAHHGLGGGGSNQYCRGYSVSRGRDTELQAIDAGTADIVLDARDRTFDAIGSNSLVPTNRWWIRQKFCGETHDRFVGYADRYAVSWPEKGKDSVTVVSCSDELKLLNLDNLPVTNPPRDTYNDLVLAADPDGFWRCDDVTGSNTITGSPGETFSSPAGTVTNYTAGPILGELTDTGNYALSPSQTWQLNGTGASASETPTGDIGGLGQFTVEFWLNIDAVPSSTTTILGSPSDGGASMKWFINLKTDGSVEANAKNSVPTTFTVTSSPLSGSTWYHFVWTLLSGTLTLYVNGASVGTAAFSGSFTTSLSTSGGTTMRISTGASMAAKFSKVAFYKAGFSSSVVQNHYTAGTARGFPTQNTGDRVSAVLDRVASIVPRRLRVGARSIVQTYLHGQNPLEEIRDTTDVEAIDAMFYTAKNGDLVFLDSAHRSVSPWNTAQIIFDDDGTDEPYLEAVGENTDSFLANVWNVTRAGGTTQTASDTASISKNKQRPQSLTGLRCVADGDASTIAAAMLAKYKNPLKQLPSVKPNMNDITTCLAAFARDIGDRIEIIRRPLGGGSPIDQLPWIQKINETGKPGEPINLEFVVSPV